MPPRNRRLSLKFGVWFNVIVGVVSVIALINPATMIRPAEEQSIEHIDGGQVVSHTTVDYSRAIHTAYLIFLCLMLLLYIFHMHRKKMHRYSQTTQYTHYAAHIIRDSLYKLRNLVQQKEAETSGREISDEADKILRELLDCIAGCFSVLIGKNCRVCLKAIDKDSNDDRGLTVIVHARDKQTSHKMEPGADTDEHPDDGDHLLCDDTPCNAVLCGQTGHYRVYCCNDVPHAYSSNHYRSASFGKYGGLPVQGGIIPGVKAFYVIKKWTLPYKSTMAAPVWCKSPGSGWRAGARNEESGSGQLRGDVWGFLCVDCNSRNVFDPANSEDLLCSFADMIYSYLEAVQLLLNLLPDSTPTASPAAGSDAGATISTVEA